MATCSSEGCKWMYDVFLSFRGKDTRKTFTGHLYRALDIRGIHAFQDDKRLEKGTLVPFELHKAIEMSQVSVIIFSHNYASSEWCLDELVKIMECRNRYEQIVIPIFYNVDPSIVRNQTESFAEAFDKHGSKYNGGGMEKVQKWRNALTLAANIAGWDVRNGTESECILRIVDLISSTLYNAFLSSRQDIVGMNTPFQQIKYMLEMEINDVRFVGIWGMGGVGKTTIARAIFDELSCQFESSCFLADVKETEARHEMHSLQNTLLSKLLRNKVDYIYDKYDGKHMIASRLHFKKVLIVLDDIDHREHLDYLAGDICWFGNGSRIIVTTRDKHLLGKNDAIYEMTTLTDHEAIQLFNQYAFKNEIPDKGFEKLSMLVVNHAKGLPLALKVWGCFLHKRCIIEWQSTIERIKNDSSSEIFKKLKVSYDGLEPIEQEIFLDIACFFRGYKKDYVIKVLESCHMEPTIGLSILIEKSLVFIAGEDTIQMHDLIQDMGKYVVKMQKDPGNSTRLWLHQDIEEVMLNNTVTNTVEAIWICFSRQKPTLCFSKHALKSLTRLRMLHLNSMIRDDFFFDPFGVFSCHDGPIEFLPNNLRWFVWKYYPSETLPANFEPKRLVHLQLECSLLHQLWTEIKYLTNLKTLDLSFSKRLIQTPNFKGMPNLETLHLKGCINLEEVHQSLGYCKKLIFLNLKECKSLKRLPSSFHAACLKYMDLEECSSLENFPHILGSMHCLLEINLKSSGIRKLPSSIGYLRAINQLDFSWLEDLVTLPNIICKLTSLKNLDVSGCSKLETLPESIGDLKNLENLDARCTLISRPPSSIGRLNKLKSLRFSRPIMEEGQAAVYFLFPPFAKGLRSLELLDLSYCNLIDGGLPEDIGCLSSLRKLDLEGNNFVHLPQSIALLCCLQLLNLTHCKMLKELPELPPNMNVLRANYHLALRSIHRLETRFKKLQLMVFTAAYGECDEFNDLLAQTLLQFIYSLQHIISASDLSQQGVLTMVHPGTKIPSWFHHKGMGRSVLISLPENWYASGNFLGFAICCSQWSCEIVVKLMPQYYDDKSEIMSQKVELDESEFADAVYFLFVPLASLWDASKANGKTPDDYGHLEFSTFGVIAECGIHLVYKDKPELEGLLPCWNA